MITLRRSRERKYERRQRLEAWLTFSTNDPTEEIASGFGSMELFREERIPPKSTVEEPSRYAEVLTYVRTGTLSYEDTVGRPGLLGADEFQRMTAGPGIRYGETNASPTEWAHIFQLWLRPYPGKHVEAGHEQKRFGAAQRRDHLCLIASPDGRRGTLLVHQDAFLYSSILAPGQHIAHELGDGRGVWLHLVEGAAKLGPHSLTTGDGAGIVAEPSVSLTAVVETEILLLDMGRLISVEDNLH